MLTGSMHSYPIPCPEGYDLSGTGIYLNRRECETQPPRTVEIKHMWGLEKTGDPALIQRIHLDDSGGRTSNHGLISKCTFTSGSQRSCSARATKRS